jgi:hypothetical protein
MLHTSNPRSADEENFQHPLAVLQFAYLFGWRDFSGSL